MLDYNGDNLQIYTQKRIYTFFIVDACQNKIGSAILLRNVINDRG